MKNIFSLKKSRSALSLVLCCLPFITITAQQMTAFERVGTDDESIQEFFPGEHRARPVLGAYTTVIWDCFVAGRIWEAPVAGI